jgi:MATE family multidrug resistance protein
MISQLGNTMVQTTASIIVGNFAGTISLAAVSLVNSVFMIVLVVGLGIAYGLTPLVAQENGRKNNKECANLFSNSLFLNIAIGVVLFLAIYFGSMKVIDHLDQDPEVVKVAKPYLFILSLSIIPIMIFSAFKQFAEGLGFTRQAMNIMVWGNILNIVLAFIFVKGMFGIAPMGVIGVGYSTFIDRIVMAIAMGLYIFRSKTFRPYIKHFTITQIDKVRSIKIFKIGYTVALQYVFEIGAFAVAAVLAGTIGANEQAAHQVAINLAAMAYMMASGVAAAATIQTGNNLGKGNIYRVKTFAITSYHIVIALMLATGVIFLTFNYQLPWLFTSDNNVIYLAAQLLIIAGLFQLFDGTQVLGLGILRGLSDVNVPTILVFFAYWIVGLPLAYFLSIPIGLGLKGIWYGLTVGLITSSTLLFIRYRRQIKYLK